MARIDKKGSMAGTDSVTTSRANVSGSKAGDERCTETPSYGPLTGKGGGVPAVNPNGGKPYMSNSPSRADDSY